jgi:hypothetical protein
MTAVDHIGGCTAAPKCYFFAEDEGITAEIVLIERLGDTSLLYLKVDGLPQLVTVELQGKPRQAL